MKTLLEQQNEKLKELTDLNIEIMEFKEDYQGNGWTIKGQMIEKKKRLEKEIAELESEIIYYKNVLALIKSVLPVIIYPNEPESLALKICKIKIKQVRELTLRDELIRFEKFRHGGHYKMYEKRLEQLLDEYLNSKQQ